MGQKTKVAKVIKHKEQISFKISKHCKAFAICLKPNKRYAIVMGDYQLSKLEFSTIKKADDYIAQKPYELIINAAFAAANFIINNKKQQNNEENNQTNAN